jgi:hypothetical protein
MSAEVAVPYTVAEVSPLMGLCASPVARIPRPG